MTRKEEYNSQDDETKIANFKKKLERQELSRMNKMLKEKEAKENNTGVVSGTTETTPPTKFKLTDDPSYCKNYYQLNKEKIKARYNAPERKEWYDNHKRICRERYKESAELYKESIRKKYSDVSPNELKLMWKMANQA